MDACKSKNWGSARYENSLLNLILQSVDPEFQFSTSIKFEHMPENKAPRFLLADQDEGQILSLLTIKCVEDLTKRAFPKKTIKGKSKKEAMEELINELTPPAKARQGAGKTCRRSLKATGLSLKTNRQRPGRKAGSLPNVLPWLSGALLAISFRELVD